MCAFILKVVALVYCCCVNVWQLLVQCVCVCEWASIAAGGLQLRFLQPEKLQDPPCEPGARRVSIYCLFIIKVMQEAAAASCERSSSLTCEASGQNLWKVWLIFFSYSSRRKLYRCSTWRAGDVKKPHPHQELHKNCPQVMTDAVKERIYLWLLLFSTTGR